MNASDEELIRLASESNDPKLLLLAEQLLERIAADEAFADFKQFAIMFWPLCVSNSLRQGWYFDAICDHLQAIQELKRLIISVPPRHAKSTLTAVMLPAWMWLHNPTLKFICASYSLTTLSERDSIACRNIIESPQYQKYWHKLFRLRREANTKQQYSTDKLGVRYATSCPDGPLTGSGCNVLICDDLNNIAQMTSDAHRRAVIRWWQKVVSTRMDPGGLDCKIVIAQRCHEEDITGHILAEDHAHEWTHLCLPYEYDSRRKCTTKLPWSDPRTEDGEVLSNLYKPEHIAEKKSGNGLGAMGFAMQFNQIPTVDGGTIFRESWFKFWSEKGNYYILDDDLQVKKKDCRLIMTTDLAISLKQNADWTIADIWAITPQNQLLLIDEWRAKVEGPAAVKGFKQLFDIYDPEVVYVEDVAFQRMMLQMLRQEGLPVLPLKPQGSDKKARCQRSLIKAECGQVHLPAGRSESWVKEWLHEVCSFPLGRHDDRVDSFSYAGMIAAKYRVGKPTGLDRAICDPRTNIIGITREFMVRGL